MEIMNEGETYYNDFNLTDKQLYYIAKWAIFNEGYAFLLYDDLNNEDYLQKVVGDFKAILSSRFPEGFKNTPSLIPAFRFVGLNDINDLDKNNLGYSWFTDPKTISNNYLISGLDVQSKKNIYVLHADIPISEVNVARSIIQRALSAGENELVLKTDKNINLKSIIKFK